MVGTLLLRGMLVGVVAGLLAFGFARMFGEPSLERAIAFEEQMAHANGEAHQHQPELVSRRTQAGPGLFAGIVVYGAAIGGLFALAFAFVHGRLGRLRPRATAAVLALAGFVAVALVPAIIYPANPPSVGAADTIGARTLLYFALLLISVTAIAVAVVLARRLAVAWGVWNATLLGAAAFVIIVVIARALLPQVEEVPQQFSATLLWQFRLAALGVQAVLWTALGLLFGGLTERSLDVRRPAN